MFKYKIEKLNSTKLKYKLIILINLNQDNLKYILNCKILKINY